MVRKGNSLQILPVKERILKYHCGTSLPFDANRRERRMVRQREFPGATHLTNFSILDLWR